MRESVLIIDDDPRIAVALTTRLRAAGYEVVHAGNGYTGLEAAALHRPNVILLDIRMPDIDGYEVCLQLKQTAELRDTPVVFLSANVRDSARRRAMEVGGSAFLSKPYEAAEVIATIVRVTGPPPTPELKETEHV